tara:strand:- start:6712 stop:7584 length:873 start_codon:yes stop_codon:yes gene_type:complete
MNLLILKMFLNEFKNHFTSLLSDDYPKYEINIFFKRLTHFYFGWSPTFSFLNPDYLLDKEEFKKLNYALKDLKKFKPLQYIFNEAHFCGREFYVNENVLIPRRETEELVKWVLNDFNDLDYSLNLLEIGTGSGCISISLAKEQSLFNIEAIEISEMALSIAKKNSISLGAEISFFQEDISELKLWHKTLDVIISNPPYIEPNEKKEMMSNVLDYEPHLALFTPENDPLYFYKKIIHFAQSVLRSNGIIYFEINPKYFDKLRTIIKNKSFKDIELRNDIFGKIRMLKAVKS